MRVQNGVKGIEGGEGGQEEVRGVCCHFPLPLFLKLVLVKYGAVTIDGLSPYNPFTRLLSGNSSFYTLFDGVSALLPQTSSAPKSCLHGPW